jgi:hypothetical protein
MKKAAPFILILAVLSGIAGYFLSKASLVGRVGISLFYKQYKFLKVWWQGALTVFVVLIVLLAIQGWLHKKLSTARSRMIHIVCVVVALVGLYFTYDDFRHTTTHRWLGERFHIGGYLFWLGWIMVSLFYLVQKKSDTVPTVHIENSEVA